MLRQLMGALTTADESMRHELKVICYISLKRPTAHATAVSMTDAQVRAQTPEEELAMEVEQCECRDFMGMRAGEGPIENGLWEQEIDM